MVIINNKNNMFAKVPIRWQEIAGKTVITPDLRGVEGVEWSSFIDKNDTHLIVEVGGNIGNVTVPVYETKEEAIQSL